MKVRARRYLRPRNAALNSFKRQRSNGPPGHALRVRQFARWLKVQPVYPAIRLLGKALEATLAQLTARARAWAIEGMQGRKPCPTGRKGAWTLDESTIYPPVTLSGRFSGAMLQASNIPKLDALPTYGGASWVKVWFDETVPREALPDTGPPWGAVRIRDDKPV